MDISELYKLFLKHPVVTTDSRDCPKDSIFFALKGTSFNGNEFAGSALEKGCAYAVIDQKEYQIQQDERYILVEDCLQTLKQLANYHRRKLGIPIIGITGTNGKTTTKELLAAVLAERFNVWYTQGNFNNEIGVPKTLLRLTSEHEIAVVEMGASHPGDIQSLVNVVEPDYALITNVGRAHLQGFGSFEGVKRTKAELYDYMEAKKPNGKVFINQDNPYLQEMFQAHCPHVQRISYSQTQQTGISYQGKVCNNNPFLTFQWRHIPEGETSPNSNQWYEVHTHLVGAYNLDNLLAAISIGHYLGVQPHEINHALTHYTPSNNRSQLEVTKHNNLIVDAYNANPTSMEAALVNFAQMQVAPKMAILGDMRELGEVSVAEHQKIINLLNTLPIQQVWLVGEEFGKTTTTFQKYKNIEEVKEAIRQEQPQGFYILIKGSNGIKLFQLPELL